MLKRKWQKAIDEKGKGDGKNKDNEREDNNNMKKNGDDGKKKTVSGKTKKKENYYALNITISSLSLVDKAS